MSLEKTGHPDGPWPLSLQTDKPRLELPQSSTVSGRQSWNAHQGLQTLKQRHRERLVKGDQVLKWTDGRGLQPCPHLESSSAPRPRCAAHWQLGPKSRG